MDSQSNQTRLGWRTPRPHVTPTGRKNRVSERFLEFRRNWKRICGPLVNSLQRPLMVAPMVGDAIEEGEPP